MFNLWDDKFNLLVLFISRSIGLRCLGIVRTVFSKGKIPRWVKNTLKSWVSVWRFLRFFLFFCGGWHTSYVRFFHDIPDPADDSRNHQMEFVLECLVSVIFYLISCGSIWSFKRKHLSIFSYTLSVLRLAWWLEKRSQTPINEIWSTHLLLSCFQPSLCVTHESLKPNDRRRPSQYTERSYSFIFRNPLCFLFLLHSCFLFFFFLFGLSLFPFSTMNMLIMFQVKSFLSSAPNGLPHTLVWRWTLHLLVFSMFHS